MSGKGRGNGNDSRKRDDNGDEDEDEGKKNRKKNVDKTVVWLVVMDGMDGRRTSGRTDFHALATENGYLGAAAEKSSRPDWNRQTSREASKEETRGDSRSTHAQGEEQDWLAGLVGRNAPQAPQHPASQWQR